VGMAVSLDKFNRYIESQFLSRGKNGRWQAREGKPFITISRQAGAGGVTIAEEIARRLDERDKNICPWTVFDKPLIHKVIEEHNLPEKFAQYMTESKVSEVDDTLEDLFGLHPARWVLARKTTQTILHLAASGYCILVGRGANIATAKFPGGFHVRLIGSYPKRLKHIQDYYRLDKKSAAEFIKKEDKGRADYLKKYFGKNSDDPLLYHLVVNTDLVSYEAAARIIADVAPRGSNKKEEVSYESRK